MNHQVTKTQRLTKILFLARTPLYRNGAALMFSGAATSALGLVYWGLAARCYTPQAVGLNSAALSALTLIAAIAQLGLNSALVRFGPAAGKTIYRLALGSYAISTAAAALAGLAFSLGVRRWAPGLQFFLATPPRLAGFALAVMTWCVFSLQDSLLTGLRQAAWVPLENILFSLLKILLMAGFARPFPEYGIFASWALPAAALLLPVNLLIFRRLIPAYLHDPGRAGPQPAPGQVARFIAGNYPGSLFALGAATLPPVMVLETAGAQASAYFYLPWIMASALQAISASMAASLTVEAARDPTRADQYSRQALVHTLGLLVPLALILWAGAPAVLRLFGVEYSSQGAALLRWLSLASIPNLVLWLGISRARVKDQPGRVALLQSAMFLLGLGLSDLLLARYGIRGVGIAWLLAQSVLAILLAATSLRPVLFGPVKRLAPAGQPPQENESGF